MTRSLSVRIHCATYADIHIVYVRKCVQFFPTTKKNTYQNHNEHNGMKTAHSDRSKDKAQKKEEYGVEKRTRALHTEVPTRSNVD